MRPFAPVTDADLAQARQDPVFRQKLLTQSLEVLLAGLQKTRSGRAGSGADAKLVREGVALAVKLAELIQAAPPAQKC